MSEIDPKELRTIGWAYRGPRGGLIVTEDKPTHAPEARAVTDLSRAQAEIDRLVKWKDELLRAEKTQRLARESAEADLARAREALTPSADTKAAYIGEFSFGVTLRAGNQEDYRRIEVPWTAIKEIMAAIKARAALPNTTGEAE